MFVRLVEGVEKLNAFPSAEAIIDEFRFVGIIGRRFSSGNCPVANYLRLPIGIPASKILVDGWYVLYRSESNSWNRSMALSPAVTEFIVMFDCGQLPEFISEGDFND